MPENSELGRSVEFPCFESEFEQQDVVTVEFGDISQFPSHNHVLKSDPISCRDESSLKQEEFIETDRNNLSEKSSKTKENNLTPNTTAHTTTTATSCVKLPETTSNLNEQEDFCSCTTTNTNCFPSVGGEKHQPQNTFVHQMPTTGVSNVSSVITNNQQQQQQHHHSQNNSTIGPVASFDSGYYFHVPHYISNDGNIGFNKEYPQPCLTVAAAVDGKYYYTPYYFAPAAHYIGPLMTDKGIIQGCFYNYNGAETYRYMVPHETLENHHFHHHHLHTCRDLKQQHHEEVLEEENGMISHQHGLNKVDCSVQTDDWDYDSFQYEEEEEDGDGDIQHQHFVYDTTQSHCCSPPPPPPPPVKEAADFSMCNLNNENCLINKEEVMQHELVVENDVLYEENNKLVIEEDSTSSENRIVSCNDVQIDDTVQDDENIVVGDGNNEKNNEEECMNKMSLKKSTILNEMNTLVVLDDLESVSNIEFGASDDTTHTTCYTYEDKARSFEKNDVKSDVVELVDHHSLSSSQSLFKQSDTKSIQEEEIPTSSALVVNGTEKCEFEKKTEDSSTKKSWASLFKDDQKQEFITTKMNSLRISASSKKPEIRKKNLEKSRTHNSSFVSKYTPRINGFHSHKEISSGNTTTKSMSEILKKHFLKSSAPALTPRGIYNDGNWCYMNATLQALLACPHFYNFIETIPMPKTDDDGNVLDSTTPFLSHISYLFKQFPPMYRSGGGKASRTEIQIGEPLKITALHNLASSSLYGGRFGGKQEDAHEFLTKLLTKMHTESYMCMNNSTAVNESENQIQDDAEWQEMYKHKTHWFREVQTEKTPISDIFSGCFRLTIEKAGSKATSNLEPFYSVSLNPENSNMIKALKCLKERVPVTGFNDPVTQKPIKAFHSTYIEKLPPCLIIHSKCFVVNKNSTVQKITKRFPLLVDLVIPEEVLSRSVNQKNKKYKLFAVIHHCGRNIESGHYISDVFHPGLPGWIRCDDHKISIVPSKEVLNSSLAELTPYLLLYREY